VIAVSELRKHFRQSSSAPKGATAVTAADGVSITVKAGELLVLLGPSGCGKTTLLRCVAGLEKPDDGEISVQGNTVYSGRRGIFLAPEKRNLGMMFQSYALWPHMNVIENITYPLKRRHSVPRGQVAGLAEQQLAALDLNGLGHRYPGELSGGQQQRVALARALVGGTNVVLFDEPLSNVDATVRRRLRGMLRRLKDEIGFSGIYVTHDQEEALELADVVAVMKDGRIEQLGSPREIYEQPKNLYVADFIGGGVVNRWTATVTTVGGGVIALSTAVGTFELPAPPTPPQVGDKGWLGARPQSIRVLASDATAQPTAPGRAGHEVRALVTDQVYFGTHIEYRMTVADTPVIAVAEIGQGPRCGIGDEVLLSFVEGRILWLPQ
jgi:iron(III) transport system ATP-binding protein